jgi:putative membrane protein
MVLLPATAWAHGLTLVPPEGIWYAWSFDPLILVPLLLTHWLYGRGVLKLWRQAGIGRGIRRFEAACFLAGELTPLLVLGRPLAPIMWALPGSWRPYTGALTRRLRPGRLLTRPSVATLIQGVALWAWHAPAPFQAAMLNDAIHTAEHVTFMGSALLFWWSIVHAGREGSQGYAAAAGWTLITVLHGGMLGALLTFAGKPLYPAYGDVAALWGLTPLEDQQLAGLIMWVPTGMVHLTAGVWLIGSWI